MSDAISHDEVLDHLEAYVDERLDRTTRAQVDRHLASCEECRAVLDGVAPIDLRALEEVTWDERSMRRAVRRSLLRTTLNVGVLLLVTWLAFALLSALVLQPLVVNRGGRAEASTQATAEVAVMLNPGATVESWRFASGMLSRTSSAALVTSTGTAVEELGTVESRLTLTGFGAADGGAFDPVLVRGVEIGDSVADRLRILGDGTVATIDLMFNEPISVQQADALTELDHDVRVTWVGFAVDSEPGISAAGFDLGGFVGGPACDRAAVPDEVGPAGAGAGSGSVFALPSSAARAHRLTVDAVEGLLAHPELLDGLGRGWSVEEVERAAQFLDEQRVRMLVVTGPTAELVSFAESAPAHVGGVRDVTFFNWFGPMCGEEPRAGRG